MVGKGLGILELGLFCLSSENCLAQSTTVPRVVPDNFILMAPPEFIGNPSTGSLPNRRWIYVGSYATERDCESAEATMKYPIVDGKGTMTRSAPPESSICLSNADHNNLN